MRIVQIEAANAIDVLEVELRVDPYLVDLEIGQYLLTQDEDIEIDLVIDRYPADLIVGILIKDEDIDPLEIDLVVNRCPGDLGLDLIADLLVLLVELEEI